MPATFETVRVQMAHVQALDAAKKASREFADKFMSGNDGGPCGFGWVEVHRVRTNSKLGTALKTVGFEKSYNGGLRLSNEWWPGQSLDAAEHGAVAYATVLKQELGIKDCFGCSRID